MEKAVSQLNWPLVSSFELAPLRAGSVVLYSHNIFHRGNHRRDDWKLCGVFNFTELMNHMEPSEEVDWTKQEKDLTKLKFFFQR